MEDSLYPPATDDAAATSTEPLYPSWVLLQEEVQYVGRENATTAEAQTFIGRAVRVTFLLADPPAVSYFGVHGPELELKDLLLGPRAVFSAKDLVLFRFVFTVRPRSTVAPAHNPAQYFVYKAAGRHGKPSLTPVPTSDRPQNFPSHPSVLPFEDEDGNFLVADLATAGLGRYNLHILSSKTNKWTTRTLQLQAPPAVISADLPVQTDKVIALGAGTIGWIDLWRGIVVCDVFDADPVLRFIPLPKPHFNLRLKGDPRSIRDVTCCSNGFIKFVEMETYPRPVSKGNFKTTKDLDTAHVLYDSELFYRSGEDLEEQPGPRTFRTCYRHTSWNLWCKGHNVHVGDILVKTPGYYTMLPQLWDDTAGKFTLRNLIAFCPVFGSSTHGGDVVYLASKLGNCDRKGWVLGVDLRKKTVEVLEPYSERYTVHQPSFLACTFSGYLNKTPSSCAPENGCGQNCPLSPGNIVQNNLNMEIVHPVNSFQFQPQLIVPPHSFPQTPQYKFIPSGPAVPFNTLMPPVPAYPAIPFNTLMPRVPMNEGFLSQVSPMPLSPAVPLQHNDTDDRFLSQMPPVHTVHHSSP